MNMDFEKKLPIPMETKKMYPLTDYMQKVIDEGQQKLKLIFEGKSNKLVLVIGPCSANDKQAILEYCIKLAKVQEKVKDVLCLVPRVYTNKPRTISDGYMGLLHQPGQLEHTDLFNGIIAVRSLHTQVIKETGLITADELLYPENYKYVDDLLGYVTVGARSVENQQHRFTASGIGVPVGMKNPTSGDLNVMMNGIYAAQHSHSFIYRGWAAHSYGNPWAHAVLRGYTDKLGKYFSNYQKECIMTIGDMYVKRGLSNPSVIVDCNHANSGKNPFLQVKIMRDVMNYRKQDEKVKKLLKGFMVESYLADGSQNVNGTTYGMSITDPCLGWEKSEQLIYELAELV